MTPEQQHFFNWIDTHLPTLAPLFDRSTCTYNREAAAQFLSSASTGEQVMARFVLGIWRHDNLYQFDVFNALKTLDNDNLTIIKTWMENPFWP